MFLNRSGSRPVQFLHWRVRLFGVAAILAVFGIGADQGWMVNVAIGVLAVSLVLGMLGGKRERTEEEWADEDDGA